MMLILSIIHYPILHTVWTSPHVSMQEYLEQHIGVKTRRHVLYQGYVEGISATGMQSNHGFDGQVNACCFFTGVSFMEREWKQMGWSFQCYLFILLALLKQQGVGLKGLAKSSTATEEVPPLLEENGKIEVWRINGNAKTIVPKEDIGKFYSGDCYIVLHTYHSNEKKEDYYLCCWIGKDSIEVTLLLDWLLQCSIHSREDQFKVVYFKGKSLHSLSPSFSLWLC